MLKYNCYVAKTDETSSIKAEVEAFFGLSNLPMACIDPAVNKIRRVMLKVGKDAVFKLAVDQGDLLLVSRSRNYYTRRLSME